MINIRHSSFRRFADSVKFHFSSYCNSCINFISNLLDMTASSRTHLISAMGMLCTLRTNSATVTWISKMNTKLKKLSGWQYKKLSEKKKASSIEQLEKNHKIDDLFTEQSATTKSIHESSKNDIDRVVFKLMWKLIMIDKDQSNSGNFKRW